MKTIKGPALFLAQFAGDEAPFNSWDSITKWAADCALSAVSAASTVVPGGTIRSSPPPLEQPPSTRSARAAPWNRRVDIPSIVA